MAKLTLADVTNIGGNPTSAANVINNNNNLIEGVMENTLSRDGSAPNQMLVDIDMNGNDLLNVDTLDAQNLIVNNTDLAEQIQIATDAASDASASASAALNAQIAAEAAEDNITALIPTINSALQPEDIGVTVQAQDVTLEALSGVTPVADGLAYFTSGIAAAIATLTTFGRSLIAAASAAAARTVLELGSLATLSSINNSNWSGTDLAVTNGGTGASDAPTALSNLGGQPTDALLTAIAGLTTAAGGFIRTTGVDTVAAQAIVGTVSQSGGTPTGAIIERGSNANGEYVRFADGTQICWISIADTSGAETASGSSFQNAADLTWTFPATFDTGTAPLVVEGSLVRSDRIGGVSFRTSPSNTNVAFRYWATTSIVAPATVTLRLMAIGRWF